jgi:4'-phosphopantetheinyl transferase
MVEVFYVSLKDFNDNKIETYINLLPECERAIISQYKSLNSQKQTLFGRLMIQKILMQKTAQKTTRKNIFPLKKTDGGKPYTDGDIYFNISHSADITAAAFSDSEVGLDIEFMRPVKKLLGITKYFCETEAEYIYNKDDEKTSFFYVWTRKEALLKAKSCGLSGKLSKYNCIENKITDNKQIWHLKTFDLYNNYAAALCSNKCIDEIKTKELHYTDFL